MPCGRPSTHAPCSSGSFRTAPICTPSHSAYITGRAQVEYRAGPTAHSGWPSKADQRTRINRRFGCIPSVLRDCAAQHRGQMYIVGGAVRTSCLRKNKRHAYHLLAIRPPSTYTCLACLLVPACRLPQRLCLANGRGQRSCVTGGHQWMKPDALMMRTQTACALLTLTLRLLRSPQRPPPCRQYSLLSTASRCGYVAPPSSNRRTCLRCVRPAHAPGSLNSQADMSRLLMGRRPRPRSLACRHVYSKPSGSPARSLRC